MKGAEIINEIKGAYEILPHELVADNSISKMARFIYIYMSAKPSDWKFYKGTMLKELEMSENTLNKYINELICSGWLEKLGQENNGGKFGCVKYVIKASKNASRKNCVTQNLSDRHNTYIKQNTDNNRENNIKKKNSKEKEVVSNALEGFEWWWNAYGKKVGKKDAQRVWLKLKAEEMQRCIDVVQDYVAATPEVRYRMNPLTYLHRRSWEDEIINQQQQLNHNNHYENRPNYVTQQDWERQQRLNGYAEVAAELLQKAERDRIARGID